MFDIEKAIKEGCLYDGFPARFVTELEGYSTPAYLFVTKGIGLGEHSVVLRPIMVASNWKNKPKEYWASILRHKQSKEVMLRPLFETKEQSVKDAKMFSFAHDILQTKIMYTE